MTRGVRDIKSVPTPVGSTRGDVFGQGVKSPSLYHVNPLPHEVVDFCYARSFLICARTIPKEDKSTNAHNQTCNTGDICSANAFRRNGFDERDCRSSSDERNTDADECKGPTVREAIVLPTKEATIILIVRGKKRMPVSRAE